MPFNARTLVEALAALPRGEPTVVVLQRRQPLEVGANGGVELLGPTGPIVAGLSFVGCGLIASRSYSGRKIAVRPLPANTLKWLNQKSTRISSSCRSL